MNKTNYLYEDVALAWVNGADIQEFRTNTFPDSIWVDVEKPSWALDTMYRVKPKDKDTHIKELMEVISKLDEKLERFEVLVSSKIL